MDWLKSSREALVRHFCRDKSRRLRTFIAAFYSRSVKSVHEKHCGEQSQTSNFLTTLGSYQSGVLVSQTKSGF